MRKRILNVLVLASLLGLSGCVSARPSSSESGSSPTSGISDRSTVASIEVKAYKKEYKEGDNFDRKSLVFDATYKDGSVEKGLTGGDIDGIDPNRPLKASDKKITVLFEGYGFDLDISVSAIQLSDLEVNNVTPEYNVGDKFNLDDLEVSVLVDGEKKILNPNQYTIKDSNGNSYDSNSVFSKDGDLALFVETNITDNNLKKEFHLTIYKDELSSLALSSKPLVTSYELNGRIDFQGLSVEAQIGCKKFTIDYDSSDLSYRYSSTGLAIHENDVLDLAGKNIAIEVAYSYKGVTKSTTFPITVFYGVVIEAELDMNVGINDTDAINSLKEKNASFVTHKGGNKEGKSGEEIFSGEGYLGGVSDGTIVDFYVYSENVVDNADIVLRASSGKILDCNEGYAVKETGDIQFNQAFRVSQIDDEGTSKVIRIDDSVVLKGKKQDNYDYAIWTNWCDVPFGTVSLNVGYTHFRVEVLQSWEMKKSDGSFLMEGDTPAKRSCNIDRLEIRVGE